MTDDDIKRLRDLAQASRNVFGESKAADAIDALLAEREILRRNRDYWMESCKQAQEHRDGANAQVAHFEGETVRLREERDALRDDAERWHWVRDWMIKQGLLRHQECQPEANMGVDWWYVFRKVYAVGNFISYGDTPDAAIDAARTAVPQPAQPEPVGEWVKSSVGDYPHLKWARGYIAKIGHKLYTAPPTRKPLTEQQIWDAVQHGVVGGIGFISKAIAVARAVERAHGIVEGEK